MAEALLDADRDGGVGFGNAMWRGQKAWSFAEP